MAGLSQETRLEFDLCELCVGSPDGSAGKESTYNAGDPGDMGSVLGWGRSPGEGNGDPLLYSCLGNLIDRGAWQATVHGVPKELDTT